MATKEPVFHDPLPPFQLLLSQPCWGIAAGAGTGAQVSLHFGRKLPRLRQVANPSLEPELRTHQGEIILFIECQWSIASGEKARFDSEWEVAPNGKMKQALQRLRGATVHQIELKMPLDTLSIGFDNGQVLRICADSPDINDPHDNFTLSYGDTSYIIGSDLGLRIEPRSGVVPILGYAGSAGAQGRQGTDDRSGLTASRA